MRLKDRVAVVTGAAAGLGRAIAERFAVEGAIVVIADKDGVTLPETVASIQEAGGQAEGMVLDVSSQPDIVRTMDSVAARHGQIDILINNAGVTRYRPFATATAEDWDAVLDVDLKGVFFCSQAVARHMIARSYGKIVNISSALGTGTTPFNTAGSPGGSAAYASAKAGVGVLTKILARELGPSGINVNCVAPGTFVTALTGATRTPEQQREHLAFRSKMAVLGRPGRLEELASAVLFMASDEASFITGHTLSVDGGRTDRM